MSRSEEARQRDAHRVQVLHLARVEVQRAEHDLDGEQGAFEHLAAKLALGEVDEEVVVGAEAALDAKVRELRRASATLAGLE